MSLPFRDRHDAGRTLAEKLHCYAGRDTIVLGIPRGGVPVGYEIAHALRAPLDLFLLRHLVLPGDPPQPFGVVGSGGVRVLWPNLPAVLTDQAVTEITQRERVSLIARERTYRGQQGGLDLRDRVVILVDDGSTSESDVVQTIAAVREHDPRAVVLAVPVLPALALGRIGCRVDDLVSVVVRAEEAPWSRWYVETPPISHTEVRALLSLASAEAQSRELANLSTV